MVSIRYLPLLLNVLRAQPAILLPDWTVISICIEKVRSVLTLPQLAHLLVPNRVYLGLSLCQARIEEVQTFKH